MRLLRAKGAILLGGIAALTLGTALASAGAASAQTAPLPVRVVEVSAQARDVTLDLTGTIEARETLPLAFQRAGRIAQMHVQIGDRVAKGDVIAALDPTQALAAQAAAQAGVVAAEASVQQSRLVYQRAGELRMTGAGTLASLEQAEQALAEAEAKRDEAAAQAAKADQAVADMVIRAPLDGTITARLAEPGQIAPVGQTIAQLAQSGSLVARFDLLNLADLGQLMGKRIDLRLVENGDRALWGQVDDISPLARAQSGTVEVQVALEASDLDLGTPVRGRFVLASGPAISLPSAALVSHLNAPAVWLVDQATSKVRIQPISVSRYTGAGIEVSAGLNPGDWVAAEGAHLLYPDRQITKMEPQK